MVPRLNRNRTAILLWLLVLWPVGVLARPAAEFIWLSDVHFDPTASPSLVEVLAKADIHDWPRILASSPPAHFARFGEDTNWLLLSSTLAAIRKTAPQAQFVMATGDLLAHNLRSKFEAAAKDHDDDAYRRFSIKTTRFVAEQLATLAPGKPVLFTLGNNDNDCGNYQVQPGGAFLKDATGWFDQLLGPLANQQTNSDWMSLGNFNVPHPSLKHYRVIGVNSIYFSPRYRNACAASAERADPAQLEMRWLDQQLAQAHKHNQKVWLIFHIPPGVDGYTTAHANAHGGRGAIVWMWKPQYTEQLQGLLTHYRGTVTISFAAHNHMDDLRLLNNSLVLMTPAISPVYLQNPAFRVVFFTQNGNLSDEKTYYLSNLNAASGGATPDWELEYNFDSTWGVHKVAFETLKQIYGKIENNSAARERWTTLYPVSAGGVITKQNFAWLLCASGNLTEVAYHSCVERVNPTLPK